MLRARRVPHASSPWVVSLILLCALSGCKRREAQASEAPTLEPTSLKSALRTYAEIALATYDDSLTGARVLQKSVESLLATPSSETLAAARNAWLEARRPYAQTEVFRFYDGPIDAVEVQVNTWPIDESFVESQDGDEPLGIVQNMERYPTLSAELLADLNGKEGETSISTGYHVIEFLLWGRDQRADGPGDRSALDFDAHQGSKQQRLLALRRASYLRFACALLLRQLQSVRDAWSDRAGSYRDRFLRDAPTASLYRALKGMAKLSGPELSGERLTVPYETKDQENEHSCFSDSTHADIVNDALGVENVCLGRYARLDGKELRGTGLCAVLEKSAPALGRALKSQISASVDLARHIPAPFDAAILGDDTTPGRATVQRTARALATQAETLERLRVLLGLREPTSPMVTR